MSDPIISNSTYGSHFDLQRRIRLRIQSTDVNARVLEVVRRTFEEALQIEGVDLTGGEKERLLKQITQFLFTEISNRLDSDSGLG